MSFLYSENDLTLTIIEIVKRHLFKS